MAMKLSMAIKTDLAGIFSAFIVFFFCVAISEHIWYVYYSLMPMLPKDQHPKIMDPVFVQNLAVGSAGAIILLWLWVYIHKRALKYPR
jgi:hypothetical protein